MTLSEIASFVTTKLSQTDSDSVAACKEFTNARYRMIWDSHLWTESLGITSVTVIAGNTQLLIENPSDYLLFQDPNGTQFYIDTPVAVKLVDSSDNQTELPAADWVSFFQVDPSVFDSASAHRNTPRNFINLPRYQGLASIRLVPTPSVDSTAYVLGKVKWQELEDSHSPVLRGIDNALIAYVEGDMLERARQYGKAQAKFSEAAAHVGTMKDLEKGQMQSISRIIPDVGAYYDSVCSPE